MDNNTAPVADPSNDPTYRAILHVAARIDCEDCEGRGFFENCCEPHISACDCVVRTPAVLVALHELNINDDTPELGVPPSTGALKVGDRVLVETRSNLGIVPATVRATFIQVTLMRP